MRWFWGGFLILFLLSVLVRAHEGMWREKEIVSDGLTRRFRYYIPKNFESSPKPPKLHILIHGWGNKCEEFCSEWVDSIIPTDPNKDDDPDSDSSTDTAPSVTKLDVIHDHEAQDHVILCPCAYKYGGQMGKVGFNAGTCCQTLPIDDVEYISKAIENVAREFDRNYARNSTFTNPYPLPFSHVYASGFSNGGMMAALLACSYPELFDSIHMINAVSSLERGEKTTMACARLYNKRRRIPKNFLWRDKKASRNLFKFSMLRIHGKEDRIFKWDGSSSLGFISPLQDDAAFRRIQQCQGNDPNNVFDGWNRDGEYVMERSACALKEGRKEDETEEEFADRAGRDSGPRFQFITHETGDHRWYLDLGKDEEKFSVQRLFRKLDAGREIIAFMKREERLWAGGKDEMERKMVHGEEEVKVVRT